MFATQSFFANQEISNPQTRIERVTSSEKY